MATRRSNEYNCISEYLSKDAQIYDLNISDYLIAWAVNVQLSANKTYQKDTEVCYYKDYNMLTKWSLIYFNYFPIKLH